MEKFENISKQMPYEVSEEYLNNLVSRVTEKAVESGKEKNRGYAPYYWAVSLAAAAAILLFVFIGNWGGSDSRELMAQAESPIDKYLNGLSEEELMQLSYYEVDDELIESEEETEY
ncbi:MAG: hypothetical protein IKZ50_04375 [Bacteroidales bacterium]|nr:hypothetical protein [Bacteroidales bacterium]MBR5907609.1 hypothetical protein [Bacteroidales bacterium]